MEFADNAKRKWVMGMRRESIYVKERKARAMAMAVAVAMMMQSQQSRKEKRASVCMNLTYPVYYNWGGLVLDSYVLLDPLPHHTSLLMFFAR